MSTEQTFPADPDPDFPILVNIIRRKLVAPGPVWRVMLFENYNQLGEVIGVRHIGPDVAKTADIHWYAFNYLFREINFEDGLKFNAKIEERKRLFTSDTVNKMHVVPRPEERLIEVYAKTVA